MANKVGNPNLAQVRNTDTGAANAKRKAKADEFALEIARLLRELDTEGARGQEMAKLLNAKGKKTRRGHKWTATAVNRVLKRLS
jgi:hypothetical protein